MSRPAVLFLLDWQPTAWSTREEFFCQLSGRLTRQGITPLLTVSGEIPKEIRERFEQLVLPSSAAAVLGLRAKPSA
jgi:hypothetical protein